MRVSKSQLFPFGVFAFLAGCATFFLASRFSAHHVLSFVYTQDDAISQKELHVNDKVPYVTPADKTRRQIHIPQVRLNDSWGGYTHMDTLRDLASKPIPEESTLMNYSLVDLSLLYHSYLDNVDVVCNLKIRMGAVGDGGWEICDDPEWRPLRPCIVYSFGINNDFTFDDDTARVYGCHVFSFDPSMKQESYNRSSLVSFYKLGIGGQKESVKKSVNNTWELLSFSDIKALLKHEQAVIDVVKMDVERAEWPSLANMIKEKQLNNVRQVLVEFHHAPAEERQKPNGMMGWLAVLRSLQQAGFRRFLTHKNHVCASAALAYPVMRTLCYEMHFVNINFKRELYAV